MTFRLAIPIWLYALLRPVADRVIERAPLERSVPIVIGLLAVFLLTILLFWFREFAVWLRYCWVRCPTCGKRRWTLGFYNGFGL